jgi:hypothetical protein
MTMNRGPSLPRRWLAALGGGMLFCAVCGCSDPGEKFLPVSGKVTLDRQPLTVGSVSFRPDASKGNTSKHVPTGDINAEGNYELYTVGRKGAPPGWYKVLVFADGRRLQPKDSPHPLRPDWLTHKKYTDEKTTDLFIEVAEAPPPGAYDLKVSK